MCQQQGYSQQEHKQEPRHHKKQHHHRQQHQQHHNRKQEYHHHHHHHHQQQHQHRQQYHHQKRDSRSRCYFKQLKFNARNMQHKLLQKIMPSYQMLRFLLLLVCYSNCCCSHSHATALDEMTAATNNNAVTAVAPGINNCYDQQSGFNGHHIANSITSMPISNTPGLSMEQQLNVSNYIAIMGNQTDWGNATLAPSSSTMMHQSMGGGGSGSGSGGSTIVSGWKCCCWNATNHDEVECRCEGEALTRVPQTLTVPIQRLTIASAGLPRLRSTGLKVYGSSLLDIALTDLKFLECIQDGSFSSLKLLRTIYISHAPMLTYLSKDVFQGISDTIKIIRIINSGLTQIPDLIHLPPANILQMIDLDNNQITRIESKSLRIKTDQLILANNDISYIDDSAFFGSQIAKLILKENKNLKEVHLNAFSGMSMQELDLSSTSLIRLPSTGLQDIEVLRIENTHTLKTIPSIYNFKNLQKAFLTHSFHCCAFKFPSRHDPRRHAERMKEIEKWQHQCTSSSAAAAAIKSSKANTEQITLASATSSKYSSSSISKMDTKLKEKNPNFIRKEVKNYDDKIVENKNDDFKNSWSLFSSLNYESNENSVIGTEQIEVASGITVTESIESSEQTTETNFLAATTSLLSPTSTAAALSRNNNVGKFNLVNANGILFSRLVRSEFFLDQDTLFNDSIEKELLAENIKLATELSDSTTNNLDYNLDNDYLSDRTFGEFHEPIESIGESQLDEYCGNFTFSTHDVECYPIPNALNPCEDVMGYQWLRISVWIVVTLAVVGNVAVLVVILSIKSETSSVPRFLMCHLAFADLCLGLYLLLIASIDADSMGEYFNYAFDWQYGAGCKVAGFLTVFASHLSVFTLTVITIERWLAITHALHLNRRIKLRPAAYIMVGGWIYSIVMSLFPLFGISNYSSTSICLPFEDRDTFDTVYLVAIMGLNGCAFFIIAICYAQIYLSLGHETRHANTSIGDMSIAKKMALLVFTNFACWAPIAFFGMTALAGYPLINVTKSKILLVFFYPLNSCADPYLYAILTSQYRQDLYTLLSKFGLCQQKALKYKNSVSIPCTTNYTFQHSNSLNRNSSRNNSLSPKNNLDLIPETQFMIKNKEDFV